MTYVGHIKISTIPHFGGGGSKSKKSGGHTPLNSNYAFFHVLALWHGLDIRFCSRRPRSPLKSSVT